MHTLLKNIISAPSEQAVDRAAALFYSRSLKKGQTVLRQNDIWSKAYLIETGLLRMHVIGFDGKEFNKSFHFEGALICPLTAEMEQQPSLFAITALEASRIWEAPVAEFRSVLGEYELWETLHTRLLERLISQKLQREYDLLTLDGTSRYLKLCQTEPKLVARVPVAQLAGYLGLTDVSLSRIRRGLKHLPD